ncbi:gliding motility-associated C-terminal domain-containing protein [Arthrospiribacter ruber]|uniref:C-terminal domain of CHU protein family protein n=1 Tax=Arthrospiribacter ruber TaxID=2487934 RepID=A0A951IVV2_9BACT|nr:gliding motility-associated C-terminal domain-containing protein [Arthrospiribacter ruber]MBW3467174.1 hypothetical protein [Arthrospiribacter ruber]
MFTNSIKYCILFIFLFFSFLSFSNNNIILFELRNDPELTGPERLCAVFGSVIAEFSAGGIPATDRYSWTVTDPSGNEIFSRSGRGEIYETVPIRFNSLGNHTVSLEVTRGSNETVFSGSRNVEVIQGPEITLRPDYLLCGDEPTTISALPENTPQLNQYTFEWTNAAGNQVGNQNELVVSQEGSYFVALFFTNSEGGQDCLITGSTYVGPPDDFVLSISQDEGCGGQTVQVTADTPLRGDWSVIKQGESDRSDLGNSFSLNLNTETDLNGPGNYTIFFSVVNPQNPNCVSERSIPFTLTDGPEYISQNVSPASSCSTNDGAFEIEVESNIGNLKIIELGYEGFNFTDGEVIPFDNIPPGIYTIEAETNGCFKTSIVIVPSLGPEAQEVYDVNVIAESCNGLGINEGTLEITFINGIIEGEYRLVTGNGGVIEEAPIPNLTSFTIDLPGDFYAFEITDTNGCTIPWESVLDVERRNRVSFSVPSNINICESFALSPSGNGDLEFELSREGQVIGTFDSGESFDLTEGGNYSILGREKSSDPERCPRRIDFQVNVSEPLEFDVELVTRDCFGNMVYEAELFGRDPESVTIRWRNNQGEIVGRGVSWIPTAYETFFLEVQPRGSGFCAIDPVQFNVVEPIFSVEVEIEADPFCPDAPFTVLTAVLEREDFNSDFRWIFIDPDGELTALSMFDGERSIAIEEEGTYEVLVLDEYGCELGSDVLLVLRTLDDTRPEVNDSYSVCQEINLSETINPGEFESYEWYFNGSLVSTDPTFRPLLVGAYSLVVTNADGCPFEAEFETFEDCDFQYVFPTGMVLTDPEKLFEVFVNDAVESAQVWIHNRQGQLIFFCEDLDVQSRVSFCQWDGTFSGELVPTGTYVVTLKYDSERFGVNEKVSKNLVIMK